MTPDAIVQVVATLGFPIVMCGLMAWFIKYMLDKHREETSELRKAVENNTVVLTKLVERLEEHNV